LEEETCYREWGTKGTAPMEGPYPVQELQLLQMPQGVKARRGGEEFARELEHIAAKTETIPEGEPSVSWFKPAPYGSNGIDLKPQARSLAEQIRMYREDQLLSHPGGDRVDFHSENPLHSPESQGSFFERLAKDIKDAMANLANFFKDLFTGSTFKYVDEEGKILTGQRRGLLGNVLEFFKDLASGLSLGFFRPDGEPEPKGLVERLSFAGKKIFGQAILDDIVFGIPNSSLNMVDDAILGIWNLVEVIPDATLGSLPGGDKIVTEIFDNGQVLIDYVTDCLPGGDAWMRVHAYKLEEGEVIPPIVYNLTLPERYSSDPRWATVRNTPFRKTIETIGSLLADLAIARFTTHSPKTSRRREIWYPQF
jgi:hypothetical protein